MISHEEILKRLIEKEEDKEKAKIKKQRFVVCENIKKVKEDQQQILIPLREQIIEAEKEVKQKQHDFQNAEKKVNSLRAKLFAESIRLTHAIQEGEKFLIDTAPEKLIKELQSLRNEFDRLLTTDFEESRIGDRDPLTLQKTSVVEPDIFEVRDMIRQVKDKIKQVEYEILNPVEEDA